MSKRLGYLVRNGLTKEEFERRLKEGDRAVSKELMKWDREHERQVRKEDLKQTMYSPGYRHLVAEELPMHLKIKEHKASQSVIARS